MKEKTKGIKASRSTSGDKDARPLESDRNIWVKVDGGRKVTLHRVIMVNSAPGVTPVSHEAASMIRKLKVGESYSDHGHATVERVAKPVKRRKAASKSTGKAKAAAKPRRLGLSGGKPRSKPKPGGTSPALFTVKRDRWNS